MIDMTTPHTSGAMDPAAEAQTDPNDSGEPALTVRNLSVNAGLLPLVRDVSFTVDAGQRVGIIGASGSGKTLTCMAIAGLLPSELSATGSVHLAGNPTNMVSASERELAAVRGRLAGMVFQEPMTALNPTMRIDRQIIEGLTAHAAGSTAGRQRRPMRAFRDRALSLLTAVGLDDAHRIARSFPHELSGGQRQRVVLAMALVNNPSLLICDEPTTALDVSVQATVLTLIDERLRALGSALLFISHNLAVVASLCDYLLVMWHGRIVERGAVIEVLTAPQHEHTRQLLADADLGQQDPHHSGPGEADVP